MDSGIANVAGLATFGFWIFVAAAVVGGIWDGIRKREAEHETLRRIIESGKEPDPEVVDKLLGHKKKPTRELKVAGLIVVFVAPGLAVMGFLIGEDTFRSLLGVAALVAFVGIGLLTASKFLERAAAEDENPDNRPLFR